MMNPFIHFDLWDLPIAEANVYIVYVMGFPSQFVESLDDRYQKTHHVFFFNQNFLSVFTSAL